MVAVFFFLFYNEHDGKLDLIFFFSFSLVFFAVELSRICTPFNHCSPPLLSANFEQWIFFAWRFYRYLDHCY